MLVVGSWQGHWDLLRLPVVVRTSSSLISLPSPIALPRGIDLAGN